MGCKLGSNMEYCCYSNPLPVSTEKKLCLSPIPPPLTLQLDLSPVTVANLTEGLWGEKAGTKRRWRGKKKLYIPKKTLLKVCRSSAVSQRRVVLFLGSPEVCEGKVRLLYVSWFRKVGNESYHHPDIHTSAYSDGEGCKE